MRIVCAITHTHTHTIRLVLPIQWLLCARRRVREWVLRTFRIELATQLRELLHCAQKQSSMHVNSLDEVSGRSVQHAASGLAGRVSGQRTSSLLHELGYLRRALGRVVRLVEGGEHLLPLLQLPLFEALVIHLDELEVDVYRLALPLAVRHRRRNQQPPLLACQRSRVCQGDRQRSQRSAWLAKDVALPAHRHTSPQAGLPKRAQPAGVQGHAPREHEHAAV